MNCETFTAALFDEAPRPPGFEAHRDSCPACRDALAGHQAATALQGAPVFLPTRVRGRAVATRVAVVAGLLLVVGVGLRATTRPQPVQAPPEAGLGALAPRRTVGGLAIAQPRNTVSTPV